ncbi:MAG: PUR family DNA/RNA-binding protein [Chitinophagales bacterium]|nr:PUR family DNA/RNA-binding protein [Chitinophagales bacterium]
MDYEKKGNSRPESVFSRKIKAGKRRTYFFDVKSTKANDYFLTITESKKRPDDSYERFKIFLYKEDFNKFIETLTETIDHIKKELMPDFDFDAFNRREFQQDSNNNYNESSAPVEPKPEAAPEERPMPDNPPAPDVPPAEEDLKW